MIPPLAPLRTVLHTLEKSGIQAALGGSGLLYSLGLVDSVRDWDLTTDAPVAEVIAALQGLPWKQSPTGDQSYATASRINVTPDGADIDLMVRFAVRTPANQVVHLPTIVCGDFQGIPVGSPEVWAVAYALIGRPAKADLLNAYLRKTGARSEIRARIQAEPLPEPAKRQVDAWESERF